MVSRKQKSAGIYYLTYDIKFLIWILSSLVQVFLFELYQLYQYRRLAENFSMSDDAENPK